MRAGMLTCFVDETGGLHEASQPVFGVGLLVVRDVAQLTDLLHTTSLNLNGSMRQKRLALQRRLYAESAAAVGIKDLQFLMRRSRHHEYKFTEVRPYNVQEYKAILNVFFSVFSSEFHAILIERSPRSLAHCGKDSWPTYVFATKALLKRRLKEPSFVCCDWQGKPKKHDISLEDELCTLKQVEGCLRMTSETSPFLQVVDLLVGAASFDWRDERGFISESTASTAKRDLVRFVKSRLGMREATRFLPRGRRYGRRTKPIALTVWEPDPLSLEMSRAQVVPRGQSRLSG